MTMNLKSIEKTVHTKTTTTLQGKLIVPGNRSPEGMAIIVKALDKQILPELKEFVITIKDKKLFPDLGIIPSHQEIRICNASDNGNSVNHNIYSPGPLYPFDMGIIEKTDTTGKIINPMQGKRQLNKGILSIYCSIYEGIEGHYKVVSSNERGTVVQKDGFFSFDNLPPGKYHLSVWQKEQRFNNHEITIKLPLTHRLQINLFRPRIRNSQK